MADGLRLDVIQFVDLGVERKSAWGPGEYASRQIAINGQLLGDYLAAVMGAPVEQSTPIVEGHTGTIAPAAYLRALLGGPKDDALKDGRVAIGYCDACLDGTCGVLLGASLGIQGNTVLWSSIGFEQFDDGQAPKLTPFWKKSGAAEAPAAVVEPWVPVPFAPEITLRFDKDAYLEAVQAERRRLAAAQ
jgi:hypothetical protein